MNKEDKDIHSVAIFMGMTLDDTDHYVIPQGFPIRVTMCKDGNRIPLEWMKFDSSWEWLMPVLERIEAKGYRWEIGMSSTSPYHYCKIWSIGTVEGVSPLDAVYGAVLEFIKWWNNGQKISKNRGN